MCGINGMVFMGGYVRSEMVMEQIRFLFNELMVETQERGHHATGLSIMPRTGMWTYYKNNTSATEMTTDDDYYNQLIDSIDNDTASIVAHTRYYTKGKPENMLNNHPFEIGNLIGVHNGTISNDDALFTEYKDKFTRLGEVDSEIIYQLINHYNHDGITYEGLQSALEKTKLRGMFALAFHHKNEPNLVHIVKQERPMELAFWQEAGILIFNSQKDLIQNAFAKLKRATRTLWNSRPAFTKVFTVEYTTPNADTYFTLNADGETFEDMVSESKKLYLLSSAVKTYTGTNYSKNGCGTTGGGCGTRTNVTAQDSIGKIIEGELDETTGEVILFTASQIAGVVDNDDGSDMEEEKDEYCVECKKKLHEAEVTAVFNECNPVDNRVCSDCHHEAVTSALTAN